VYQVDSSVTDVASNVAAKTQSIRLSHTADLAIVGLNLAAAPPPFVVVDSPVELTLQTEVSNLGFVNPIEATMTWTIAETPDVKLELNQITAMETIIGLDQPQLIPQV
jgi:hypothetical protein